MNKWMITKSIRDIALGKIGPNQRWIRNTDNKIYLLTFSKTTGNWGSPKHFHEEQETEEDEEDEENLKAFLKNINNSNQEKIKMIRKVLNDTLSSSFSFSNNFKKNNKRVINNWKNKVSVRSFNKAKTQSNKESIKTMFKAISKSNKDAAIDFIKELLI